MESSLLIFINLQPLQHPMRKLTTLIICTLLVHSFTVMAQPLKREFRAAWIATVANIDWPSKPGLPAIEQQQEFIARLDELKKLGCNAVIVQMRPSSDAFYASKMEPWSRYLTGHAGQAPFPYYDPLVFMIEETHKRDMEFHAWFNPFRALTDSKQNLNPPNHITRKHPEWIINYGGKAYVDPGIPDAREYVIDVICDVVKRYDVDGIHIDDYFYPYRVAGQEFGDNRSYAKYSQGLEKNAWRRNNVDLFITLLNTNIRTIKTHIKFGVSPFGVWRNASKDPEGSDTRAGTSAYDDLYSDVLLWMKKGWVDYLMPQLYWEHGHKAAPFNKLMPWWASHCYERHMYYGLGVYRMVESPNGVWGTVHELMNQIKEIRSTCPNTGYAFYSASSFNKIRMPIKDSISKSINKYPALPPTMHWLDSLAPAAPVLKISGDTHTATLQWQVANPQKEPMHFVVYRFVNNEPINLDRADRMISVQHTTEFTDAEAHNYKQCTYIVTALDRMWNESKASNSVTAGQK